MWWAFGPTSLLRTKEVHIKHKKIAKILAKVWVSALALAITLPALSTATVAFLRVACYIDWIGIFACWLPAYLLGTVVLLYAAMMSWFATSNHLAVICLALAMFIPVLAITPFAVLGALLVLFWRL